MPKYMPRETGATPPSKELLLQELQTAPDPIGLILDSGLNFPTSVGLIADANGRWAKDRGLPVTEGHMAGAERVVEFLRACERIPSIQTIAVWAISPDNMEKRTKKEVMGLMGLVVKYTTTLLPELMEKNARFIHLGRKRGLPPYVADFFRETEDSTANNTGQRAALAFNFGGQQERLDAIKDGICNSHQHFIETGELPDLTDGYLSQFEDPYNIGYLDMLIRTGGDLRTSGLGRIVDRAELHFPPTPLPDFTERDLAMELVDYSFREKRYGGR